MVEFFHLHASLRETPSRWCILLLSLVECLARMVNNIGLLIFSLPHDHPSRMVTSIAHNLERKAPIGWLDDVGGDEGLFNL